jgi:hypothetical protein
MKKQANKKKILYTVGGKLMQMMSISMLGLARAGAGALWMADHGI